MNRTQAAVISIQEIKRRLAHKVAGLCSASSNSCMHKAVRNSRCELHADNKPYNLKHDGKRRQLMEARNELGIPARQPSDKQRLTECHYTYEELKQMYAYAGITFQESMESTWLLEDAKEEIRKLKFELSKVTKKTRTTNQRTPMTNAELRAFNFYWKKPVDADTDETENQIHMIPALNNSGYTDNSPSNVFRGTPNLHGLIGTWNGKGKVVMVVEEDAVEGEIVVLRYKGRDNTHRHYDGFRIPIHSDIKSEFIEKLKVWSAGKEACIAFMEETASQQQLAEAA